MVSQSKAGTRSRGGRSRSTASSTPASTNKPTPLPSIFFDRATCDWSLSEYLDFQESRSTSLQPRRVLALWKNSLEHIRDSKGGRWGTDHRAVARTLLNQHEQKGAGSDKNTGKKWAAQQERRARRKEQKASAAEPRTVNMSNTFFGAGSAFDGSVINNTGVADPSDSGQLHKESREAVPENEASESEASTPKQHQHLSDTDPLDDDCVDVSELRQRFLDDYSKMSEGTQWRLKCSGRSIEGRLQTKARNMTPEQFSASLTRFWILDLSCPVTKSWFSDEEWKEITLDSPTRSVDKDFVQYISRFRQAATFDHLRELLFKPSQDTEDESKRADCEWVLLVLLDFLHLLESKDQPLKHPHKEDWYSAQIWSPLVDKCLLHLAGMTTERKEISCQAIQHRKNSARTYADARTGSRPKPGPRFDGITRTLGDSPLEYIVMEVGPTFHGGDNARKWLTDSRKIFCAMREMLDRLCVACDNSSTIKGELQTAGIVTAGLHLQIHRMRRPQGHVYLLDTEKIRQVPTTLGEIWELLLIMVNVRAVREGVRACCEKVGGRLKGKSEEEFWEACLGKERTPEQVFFPPHETP